MSFNIVGSKATGAKKPAFSAPKFINLDATIAKFNDSLDFIKDNGEYKLYRPKGCSYLYFRLYKNGLIRVHVWGNYDNWAVLGADKRYTELNTDEDITLQLLKNVKQLADDRS